jgi:integrase
LLLRLRGEAPAASASSRIIKINDAKKAIRGACRRAKLPTYTHHSMRHFFASHAVEAGIDFKVVAEWLGHSDGGFLVAKTYSHLRADHSRQQAERMIFAASLPGPA